MEQVQKENRRCRSYLRKELNKYNLLGKNKMKPENQKK
jgi:hypothetical protein